MALFTKAECQRIEAAIAKLEAHQDAELVVAVLGRSHDYELFRCTLSVTLLWLLSAVGHSLWPHWPCVWFGYGQILGAIPAWLLAGQTSILRWLIPKRVKEEKVRARASQLFMEAGTHSTASRTGMLIMLSELEKMVVILGDRGLHARLGTETLHKYVQTITSGLKNGLAAEKVIEVIADYEVVLSQNFPPVVDKANEIADMVIQKPY